MISFKYIQMKYKTKYFNQLKHNEGILKMFKVYFLIFVIRVVLFITAFILLITGNKTSLDFCNEFGLSKGITYINVLWLLLILEMLHRFFPHKFISLGCQKQFRKNYKPVDKYVSNMEFSKIIKSQNRRASKILVLWIIVNSAIGILYYKDIIDKNILLLISLFYFVGDLICVLFFCPFQWLFMKNRCCVTCRIFNWDAIMAYTPLIFVKSFFSWSLVIVALLLLICWEYTYRAHPERFIEITNENLKCSNCSNNNMCKIRKKTNYFLNSVFNNVFSNKHKNKHKGDGSNIAQ